MRPEDQNFEAHSSRGSAHLFHQQFFSPASRTTRQRSASASQTTRQMSASASQTTRPSSASGQMPSQRYMDQFQRLVERQRQVFDEERILWQIERSDLHEKLFMLEDSLRRYQSMPSNQGPYLPENHVNTSIRPPPGFSAARTFNQTGDESRRGPGGESDAQPTRVFSDSTNLPVGVDRKPSIGENVTIQKPIAQIVPDSTALAASQTDMQKNLDGITFKQNLREPPISHSLTPQPPSPNLPPSPASLSRKTNALHSFLLAMSGDIHTKDAGHTPAAPRLDYQSDGTTLSARATPTRPENVMHPLETYTTVPSPQWKPNDSYFPAKDLYIPSLDANIPPMVKESGDIELKEPLGLKNDNLADKKFLQELDSKLQATEIDTGVSPEASSSKQPNVQAPSSDEAESEPELRFKKSMNFGAPLGSIR